MTKSTQRNARIKTDVSVPEMIQTSNVAVQVPDVSTIDDSDRSSSGEVLNTPILLTSIENAPEIDLRCLQLNEHNPQGQDVSFQGFPWNDFSCSLDALLLVDICIAQALSGVEYRERQNCGSDILKQVLDDILELMKTPWPDRTIDVMQKFRDRIRNYLETKECVIIGKNSALEDSDKHIIPSWLVEFRVLMKISCSGCQSDRVDNRRPARGLAFCVRNESLSGLKSLQDVLEFIVRLSLHRLLMVR